MYSAHGHGPRSEAGGRQYPAYSALECSSLVETETAAPTCSIMDKTRCHSCAHEEEEAALTEEQVSPGEGNAPCDRVLRADSFVGCGVSVWPRWTLIKLF